MNQCMIDGHKHIDVKRKKEMMVLESFGHKLERCSLCLSVVYLALVTIFNTVLNVLLGRIALLASESFGL